MVYTVTRNERLSIMDNYRETFSSHLKENHPTLDRLAVQKLFQQHGIDIESQWDDLHEEVGEKETYSAKDILDFLGY